MLEKETSWQQLNYDGLLAEIDTIKALLRQQSFVHARSEVRVEPAVASGSMSAQVVPSVAYSRTPASANLNQRQRADDCKQTSVMLNNLCALFGLSEFERRLMVLCVAMELDPDIPALCQEISQQSVPSMALALRCFDGHCSVLADDAPLSYFQLIERKRDHHGFVRCSLVISDWALFYLTGAPTLDTSLAMVMHPITPTEPTLPTPKKNAELLHQSRQAIGDSQTVVQLIGDMQDDQREVAALLAEQEGREIYEFSLYHLSLRIDEQSALVRRIAREVISRQCLVLIDCQRLVDVGESTEEGQALRNGLDCLLRDMPGAFLLYASEQISLPFTQIHHQRLSALSADEQLLLWQHCLQNNDAEALQPTLSELSSQYNLSSKHVRSIARSASIASVSNGSVTTGKTGSQHLQQQLWQYSRDQLRQKLHGLAQVIAPQQLDWADLILPENEINRLKSIVSQTRQRKQVYQHWGFARQVPYGLGICALFAGGSGTGKTMAARLVASMLNLDMYHVDISSVVDKYIGETEKKLDRLFQAADNSGAVLLFDEADALFGKRTKVQDARDRYANTGVSFLLQRMERYSGLSILTTNLRSAMDAAFTRRLRFIVQFPFPSEQEREQIWRRMIPTSAPTRNIDFRKLARLVLAGGAIRNITLQAAFIAAEANQPITMECIQEAVRQEYIKAEKTLDANLVKDW